MGALNYFFGLCFYNVCFQNFAKSDSKNPQRLENVVQAFEEASRTETTPSENKDTAIGMKSS